MRKYSALLSGAIFIVSGGVALAQSQAPTNQQRPPATSGQSTGSQADPRGPGNTAAPSTTDPKGTRQNSGAPTVDKGSGNSSLPVDGGR
jgi:hypothetical protein